MNEMNEISEMNEMNEMKFEFLYILMEFLKNEIKNSSEMCARR